MSAGVLVSAEGHGGLEAAEIFLRFFEGVYGGRPHQVARRLPFCGVLRAPPFLGAWAHPIRGQVEVLYLRHTIAVHAHLREEILADGSKFGSLHPIDRLATTVDVGEERAEGLDREDFKVSEEAPLHFVTILDVDARVSDGMTLQHTLEAMGDKDCIRINLHYPLHLLDLWFFCYRLPDLLEHACVYPCSCLFPPDKVEFVVNIRHLDRLVVGAYLCIAIAEDVVVVS